jgi:HlyD family secretion protein
MERLKHLMNRKLVYCLLACNAAVLGAWFLVMTDGQASERASRQPDSRVGDRVAGQGRVEPLSEAIRIGTEIPGKIQAVLVEEGDRVRSGQTIAVLENDTYRAAVTSAEAEVAQREAELRRIVNGARAEERREAQAAMEAAKAVADNALRELNRRRPLYDLGAISREELEQSERNYQVALSHHREAAERHAIVNGDAREEDRSTAEAALAHARARAAAAAAMLAKTSAKAPLAGVILRKHMNAGELVSDKGDTPIVTIGDLSKLRVRVDVDETDIGKLSVGLRAYATADAFPDRQFWGRVVRVGRMVGPKNVFTDQPWERIDTKVLQVLIELDEGSDLPVGLRVDVIIMTSPSRQE